MKIFFISEYLYPFAPGGAEHSTLLLAQNLVKEGHTVRIVTLNFGTKAREVTSGVEIIRIPFWKHLNKGQKTVPSRTFITPRFKAYFSKHIKQQIGDFKPDAIHAQNKHSLIPMIRASRGFAIPTVITLRDTHLICPLGMCTFHNWYPIGTCNLARLLGPCSNFYIKNYTSGSALAWVKTKITSTLHYIDLKEKQQAMKKLSGVVGISKGILQLYTDAGLINTQSSHVMYNLPPQKQPSKALISVRDEFSIPPGHTIMLYAGKVSLGKGIGYLLEAFDRVKKKFPAVSLVIAGKGSWPKPNTPNVYFTGSISQKLLFPLMHESICTVSSSIWPEPFSRIQLEASMMGTPSIGTRVGGTPEQIIHNKTGILVPPQDSKAMARAMLSLLKNPNKARQMGKEAKQYISQTFNPERLVPELVQFYDSL